MVRLHLFSMKKLEELCLKIMALLIAIPLGIIFWIFKKSGIFIVVDQEAMDKEAEQNDKSSKKDKK